MSSPRAYIGASGGTRVVAPAAIAAMQEILKISTDIF
jgi:hypothetical protein